MGKMKVLQSSLNGGELSPKLKGRPELPRYANGLEICDNFIPFVLGGAVSRPGTRMVAETINYAMDPTRHHLGVYTSLDDEGVYRGFCIESNQTDMRFFKGYEPTEPIENLNGAAFESIQSAQFQEWLYMVSADKPPIRLRRNTDSAWSMEEVAFLANPYQRPPGTENITLTPSALSGDITVTASADFFEPLHVGVKLQINKGTVQVSEVTDARTAQATVVADIPVPTGVNTKTKTFTLYLDPAGVGGIPEYWTIVAQADFTGETLTSAVGALPAGVTVSEADSVAKLTGLEPDLEWEEQAWSALRGYPKAVSFFEQRMILGGTKTYPTTIWGSKSGEVLNFALGTDDDAAFAFTLAAADTPIRSIMATDRVYVFTGTKEISIETGNDKPLTATNFRIKLRTNQGSSTMQPVRIGSDLVFSSLSRNRLYNLLYRFDMDRFVSNDVTIYGEHLVKEGGGLEQVVVTREPIPMLWCRTAAEGLITLTYDSEQQVSAWARITTSGAVKKIISVPDASGNDQVWVVVKRGEKYLVEAFDWSLQTDSAIVGSDPEGKATWGGLLHLEGMDVVAVADGYAVQGLKVELGQVTLPFPAKEVEIGLPFVARLKDLPPAVAGVASTISGQMSVNKIQVLLHNTKGCKVNGERIPFQQFGAELLDKPVQPFTGWKKVGALGWGDSGSGAQVDIVRDLPLPCTVLAIAKEVTAND